MAQIFIFSWKRTAEEPPRWQYLCAPPPNCSTPGDWAVSVLAAHNLKLKLARLLSAHY